MTGARGHYAERYVIPAISDQLRGRIALRNAIVTRGTSRSFDSTVSESAEPCNPGFCNVGGSAKSRRSEKIPSAGAERRAGEILRRENEHFIPEGPNCLDEDSRSPWKRRDTRLPSSLPPPPDRQYRFIRARAHSRKECRTFPSNLLTRHRAAARENFVIQRGGSQPLVLNAGFEAA